MTDSLVNKSKESLEAPAISILVPIYNVEKYLAECLNSIETQDFQDYEVICINDGSTDSSREIIQTYIDKDPRFKVIDKPNSGYGASMNMGLDQAKGKYIAILESDDMYCEGALSVLFNAVKTYNAQVVKGEFNLYWSTPNERRVIAQVNDGLPLNKVVDPIDYPSIFYSKSSIWSALYLRSFLKDNEIRFLETPGASYQDTAFNIKVWLEADEVVFIDNVILDYRQDNEQSSVNSPSKAFCICDEYTEIENWLFNHDHNSHEKAVVQRAKYNNYLWNFDRLSNDLGMQFLKQFAKEFSDAKREGLIDFDLFEPWAEADLKTLIDSPSRFNECRGDVRNAGKWNTFKHYYRLGGLPLIVKVVKYKRDNK